MAKKSKNYFDQNQELFTVLELQLREIREQVISNAAELGGSFENLFNAVEKINQHQDKQKDSDDDSVAEECSKMFESIGECITALQSSDAISQRIEHSYNTVSLIKELMMDPDMSESDEACLMLKKKVRDSYSIQDEREIFDRIISDFSAHSEICEEENGMDAKYSFFD